MVTIILIIVFIGLVPPKVWGERERLLGDLGASRIVRCLEITKVVRMKHK